MNEFGRDVGGRRYSSFETQEKFQKQKMILEQIFKGIWEISEWIPEYDQVVFVTNSREKYLKE